MLDPLPASPNALIGRDAELAVIRRQLLEGGFRLVTLTGPAGVGKTRLALAVAETLYSAFDRVRFTALAPLTDAVRVVPAIAQTLSVRNAGPALLQENVTAALRDQRVLLILDNFEQVLGAAPAVAELLAACPHLVLLVTSRAALHLRWEQQIPVLPLGLPDRQQSADVRSVSAAPAVALFVERARAVRPEFSLTPSSAAAVAAICRRLDGLPLAIELAAVRIAVLSPQNLLERLQGTQPWASSTDAGPLSLLGAGARDLPERQQTLRRAIGWSYDLLDEREQALFRRLSVFVGGCTIEAAEAIGRDAGSDVLTSIAALINASLLQREESPAGEVRLRMLELIREFALEQLERAGEAAAVRRRFAGHCLRLAEEAGAALEGPEQAAWLERLDRELDNLRAALSYLTSAKAQGGLALRLALPLFIFWDVRGHYREGLAWFRAALDRAGDAVTPVRAWALSRMGGLAMRQGDGPAARAYAEQSLDLFRKLGDTPAIARLLSNLGTLAFLEGELDAARDLFDQCTALCRELGDRVLLANTLNNRGLLERTAANFAAAATFFEECAAVSRKAAYTRGLAYALLGQGWVATGRGAGRETAVSIRECLQLAQALGDRRLPAYCVAVLAEDAAHQRQALRAVRLFAASASLLATMAASRVEPIPAKADRLTAELRAALGEEAFAAAWAEGGALSADEAVACALACDGEPDEPVAATEEPAARDASNLCRRAAAPSQTPAARLTARELAVLRLVVAGRTSKEIAQELVLSERTVENHLFRIYARLGIRGRAEAIADAIHHGLA